MECIVEQVGIFQKLIGEQPIDETKSYRILSYCFFEKFNDKLLIFNNLTKELILLDENESQVFDYNVYPLDNEVITKLIKKWFLVPTDHDDISFSDMVTMLAKQTNNNNSITLYNIFTTTACNARCFYCFEAGTRVSSMTAETADAVADYIIKHCNEKQVKIQWFGGEPLCNVKAIDIICNKLIDSHIKFTTTIITNGYLFNNDIIKRATNIWNLKLAQITLDGLEDTYNKTKNYVHDDPNPFARVIDNIGLLLEADIKVDIRMNMDAYNEIELYRLTDFLADKFGEYKNFVVHANLIYENVGFTPTSRTDEQREYIFDKYFDLYNHFIDRGIVREPVLSNRIMTNRCMADSYNATQISPEGKLGNCEHYPDEFFYGDVFKDSPRQIWTDYIDEIEECKTCALYPTCFILKRCNTNSCSEFRVRRHIYEMKRAMVNTYIKVMSDEQIAKDN